MKTAKEAKIETTKNINDVLSVLMTKVKIEIDLQISDGEYKCTIVDEDILCNEYVIKELKRAGYKTEICKRDSVGEFTTPKLIVSWK